MNTIGPTAQQKFSNSDFRDRKLKILILSIPLYENKGLQKMYNLVLHLLTPDFVKIDRQIADIWLFQCLWTRF